MPPKLQGVSSPGVSPQYAQGAVSSVRPQSTIADYKRRFEKNYAAPKKKAPKVAPKVNTGVAAPAVDDEYKGLMQKYQSDLAKQRQAAAQLFNKNKGALEANRNLTRDSITKQRGTDLDDIAQSYAARGIGRTSGIYQQAGVDYENTVAERLKNADKTFDAQVKDEADTQKDTLDTADAEYQEGLAEAAARKAAANAEAKKATPKATAPKQQAPKPNVPNKQPTPKGKMPVKKKFQLADNSSRFGRVR